MNETPATTKVVNVVIPAGYLKAGRTIMQNEAGQALPDAVGVYGHPSLGTNEILSVYCHTSGELAYVILSRSGRWIRGGFVSDLPHGNWLPADASQLADARAECERYSDQLEEIRSLFDGPPEYRSRLNLLEKVQEIATRNPLCDTPLSLECHSLRVSLSDAQAALTAANAAREAAEGVLAESRKAARWMLPFLIDDMRHVHEAVKRWPWLEDAVVEEPDTAARELAKGEA